MEYQVDQSLQRQRVCMKCKSFVTFDKTDDNQLRCPLCNHKLPPPPNAIEPIRLAEFRKLIASFHKHMKSEDPNQHSVEAALDATRMFVENSPIADDLERSRKAKSPESAASASPTPNDDSPAASQGTESDPGVTAGSDADDTANDSASADEPSLET
jgi:DNA-directed RNA polymerase subunit RPC12/RpoP